MPKSNKVPQGIGLMPFTEIFSVDNSSVTHVPLEELYPPKIHPFKVKHDKAMARLVNNIKENGVLHPGLVRPRPEGGYELISGNRRKMACELAGLTSMPVIIKELDDDVAAIAMVDCNLEQRDEILLSEKAAAYRVKMDAMCHKGIKDDKQSVEILMEQTGESRSQMFRILRLTELIDELTEKLDAKKLAFNPAVDLSYLSIQEQKAVVAAMDDFEIKPSVAQAVELKKLKQSEELTIEMIGKILSRDKGVSKEDKIADLYREFFPEGYTSEEIHNTIIQLLKNWQSANTPIPESA